MLTIIQGTESEGASIKTQNKNKELLLFFYSKAICGNTSRFFNDTYENAIGFILQGSAMF